MQFISTTNASSGFRNTQGVSVDGPSGKNRQGSSQTGRHGLVETLLGDEAEEVPQGEWWV